ncbi:hypothetical protein KBZ18_10050 [Synechococcus sp. Cruz-9H2]|uniref:hypothetical protein n=1 Tax=unclassified Synechococcus TaxID=2626047 RepID=UPI0020CC4FA1|nr:MULTISPECIES: hypothetical protein [unclassified Synechococcus]MCP9819834.1 hypothetical protein [Synechococcus sp. Cruz-9H2]MCP9844100.1 hypothetical protein [Synechococcus sp. Edmonson 11F2]MCP9856264.1 hypothetical protein [Synechococcus sp. Cruz-9C9]MCP9863549.1 hypothetical protein [Synechococcus sp. Cruz-7E5]MCP9870745.1 hypothetical protein [Synechococcus sp. Cruz-7B9]
MTEPNINTGPEPFSRWLFAQRDGRAHAELTAALAEVSQAVMDTGRAGEITLKIRIAKATPTGHQLFVADQVTAKPPRPEREQSLFFFDEENWSLSRSDPRQTALPLQEVPRPGPLEPRHIHQA